MHVELWANTGGKARVMAIIRANGGLQIEEREPVPPRVRLGIEKQREQVAGDEAFLRSLPVEFSGTFYRATLIRD